MKTTIDPELQEAAVLALGGTFGGVAALDADAARSWPSPGSRSRRRSRPGSTFKVITATAGLEKGVVKSTDTFPVESSNSLIGREIDNAHDELCGGTFVESFAHSCNTVFAPLGVDVGAENLLKSAELFGFNSLPTLMASKPIAAIDPPASTIPTPSRATSTLGETAIGQGQVLATPLQLASIAQTIANGACGCRPRSVRTRTCARRPSR